MTSPRSSAPEAGGSAVLALVWDCQRRRLRGRFGAGDAVALDRLQVVVEFIDDAGAGRVALTQSLKNIPGIEKYLSDIATARMSLPSEAKTFRNCWVAAESLAMQ